MTAANGQDQAAVDTFRDNTGRSTSFAVGRAARRRKIGHCRRVERWPVIALFVDEILLKIVLIEKHAADRLRD
jgi:hypothetical protein